MAASIAKRLEDYTLKHPQEVLIATIEVDGEEDCILIFKGFSSSLMRSTAYDPDIPVLPDTARIISIDRAQNPFNPDSPDYLELGLTLAGLEARL